MRNEAPLLVLEAPRGEFRLICFDPLNGNHIVGDFPLESIAVKRAEEENAKSKGGFLDPKHDIYNDKGERRLSDGSWKKD